MKNKIFNVTVKNVKTNIETVDEFVAKTQLQAEKDAKEFYQLSQNIQPEHLLIMRVNEL
jgi:hypothetical protein